jgi:hypothetical protein
MNFWRQYAQLTRFSERADNSSITCKGYNLPFNQVRLDNGEPVDLEDLATKAFFELIGFNITQPFANLRELNRSLFYWLKDNADNPMAETARVNDFFHTRHVGEGWTKLDRLLQYMSDSTLSETVDTTDVILIPGDEIKAGVDFFSVNIGVVGDDLVSNFSTIHCRAVASRLDRLLPAIKDVVDDQAKRYLRFRELDRESSEYLSVYKDLRCKPLWVSVDKNGSFFMEAKMNGHEKDDFSIDWGKAKFRNSDMTVLACVVAFASKSQGNRLKGKFLEDEIGL